MCDTKYLIFYTKMAKKDKQREQNKICEGVGYFWDETLEYTSLNTDRFLTDTTHKHEQSPYLWQGLFTLCIPLKLAANAAE